MKRIIIIFSIFIFLLSALKAEVLNPVKWEFKMGETVNNEAILEFKAIIDNNWHIYAQEPNGGMNPTTFVFEESDDYELIGNVSEPTNFKRKYDENFGMEYNLFSYSATFKQKIKIKNKNTLIKGYIEYFSCDDQRCLPPKEAEFEFNLSSKKNEEKVERKVENEPTFKFEQISSFQDTEEKAEIIEEKTKDANEQKQKGLWGIFIISILGGLGALLTPCVYPIIPLTVSFFMHGEEKKQNPVFKGLVFGISIILIYTFIGFLAGLLQLDLTKLSSSWIANSIFFLLFIIFAFSFFGMFELVLPSRWSNSIDKKADKGGAIGSFFMAMATVLISFSCTGPIVGVLLGKSLQGEIIQPVIGMFGFGLAFALPFTILAIFPGVMKNLPKSGGWLNSVKVFFAFILLAFSLKFLSNIDQLFHFNLLTRNVFISIWIVIFVLLGFYLMGKIKFSHDSDLKYVSIPRLILIIAAFSFAVYLIPGIFGAPLKSVSFFIPSKTENSFDLTKNTLKIQNNLNSSICGTAKYSDFLHLPHGLQGYFDYEEGIKCAKEQNKPVLLDFKGHTCTNCKAMEEKVWSTPEVLSILKNDYIIIALYVDDRTKLPEDEIYISENDGKKKNTLGKKNADFQITKFQTNALPYYVIINHKGELLADPKTTDFDVNRFVKFLEKGKENFYRK